jgi:hypothetical protein
MTASPVRGLGRGFLVVVFAVAGFSGAPGTAEAADCGDVSKLWRGPRHLIFDAGAGTLDDCSQRRWGTEMAPGQPVQVHLDARDPRFSYVASVGEASVDMAEFASVGARPQSEGASSSKDEDPKGKDESGNGAVKGNRGASDRAAKLSDKQNVAIDSGKAELDRRVAAALDAGFAGARAALDAWEVDVDDVADDVAALLRAAAWVPAHKANAVTALDAARPDSTAEATLRGALASAPSALEGQVQAVAAAASKTAGVKDKAEKQAVEEALSAHLRSVLAGRERKAKELKERQEKVAAKRRLLDDLLGDLTAREQLAAKESVQSFGPWKHGTKVTVTVTWKPRYPVVGSGKALLAALAKPADGDDGSKKEGGKGDDADEPAADSQSVSLLVSRGWVVHGDVGIVLSAVPKPDYAVTSGRISFSGQPLFVGGIAFFGHHWRVRTINAPVRAIDFVPTFSVGATLTEVQRPQIFVGGSVEVARDFYIRVGAHVASGKRLADGLEVGDLVPANLAAGEALPTTNVPLVGPFISFSMDFAALAKLFVRAFPAAGGTGGDEAESQSKGDTK